MTEDMHLIFDNEQALRDSVFETLRRAILEGKLEEGKRLTEQHIADMLGVSRTPVREALRQLESSGLVKVMPYKGAVVAGISGEALEETSEVRCALEELAAEKIRRMSGTEKKNRMSRLEEAALFFESVCSEKPAYECAKADEAFHLLLGSLSGNTVLQSLLEQTAEQAFRYRILCLRDPEMRRKAIREHTDILHALETEDESAVRSAVGSHIREETELLLCLLISAGSGSFRASAWSDPGSSSGCGYSLG